MQTFIYQNSPLLILEFGKHLICPKIEPIDIENLKKLTPAPAIPIDQLRTQIAIFRHIETNKSTSWTYYVGGWIRFWFYIPYCNMLFSMLEM